MLGTTSVFAVEHLALHARLWRAVGVATERLGLHKVHGPSWAQNGSFQRQEDIDESD